MARRVPPFFHIYQLTAALYHLRLEPFRPALESRFESYLKWVKVIEETEGGIDKFSKGWVGDKAMVSLAAHSYISS